MDYQLEDINISMRLKIDKSPGPDARHPKRLKETAEQLSTAYDRGGELDVIYLDFMKAFNTFLHKTLIGKLRSYGMSAKIVRWVTSFLLNRRQLVSVKGQFSAWADVLSGIPQRECSRTNFICPVHK